MFLSNPCWKSRCIQSAVNVHCLQNQYLSIAVRLFPAQFKSCPPPKKCDSFSNSLLCPPSACPQHVNRHPCGWTSPSCFVLCLLGAGLLQLYWRKPSRDPSLNINSSYSPSWKHGKDTCMMHIPLQTPSLLLWCIYLCDEHRSDSVTSKWVGTGSWAEPGAKLHELLWRKVPNR